MMFEMISNDRITVAWASDCAVRGFGGGPAMNKLGKMRWGNAEKMKAAEWFQNAELLCATLLSEFLPDAS